MKTKYITKIKLSNRFASIVTFTIKSEKFISLEKAIEIAIEEIGTEEFDLLKYKVEFYSAQKIYKKE